MTMTWLDEIRRTNLDAESRRLGGDSALAEALGVDPNQVYQWLRTEDPAQRRIMRTSTARKHEQRLGRPVGWLDEDHGAGGRLVRPGSSDAAPPALRAIRAGHDGAALGIAIAGIVTALARTRPSEARVFADWIRAFDPAGEYSSGLTLGPLLEVLDATAAKWEAEQQFSSPSVRAQAMR